MCAIQCLSGAAFTVKMRLFHEVLQVGFSLPPFSICWGGAAVGRFCALSFFPWFPWVLLSVFVFLVGLNGVPFRHMKVPLCKMRSSRGCSQVLKGPLYAIQLLAVRGLFRFFGAFS